MIHVSPGGGVSWHLKLQKQGLDGQAFSDMRLAFLAQRFSSVWECKEVLDHLLSVFCIPGGDRVRKP